MEIREPSSNPIISPNVLGLHSLCGAHTKMRYAMMIDHYNAEMPQEERFKQLEKCEGCLKCISNSVMSVLTMDWLRKIFLYLDESDACRVQKTCKLFRQLDLCTRPLRSNSFLKFANGFELLVTACGFVNRTPMHCYSLDATMRRTKHAVVRAFHNKFFECLVYGRQPDALQEEESESDELGEEEDYPNCLSIVPENPNLEDDDIRIEIHTSSDELSIDLKVEGNEKLNGSFCTTAKGQMLGTIRFDSKNANTDGFQQVFSSGNLYVDHPTSTHEFQLCEKTRKRRREDARTPLQTRTQKQCPL